jgi:hypothetical protein
MSYRIVPLEQEHVEAVWDKSIPYTLRGVAAVDDNCVLGVAGIHLGGSAFVLVSKAAPEMRRRYTGFAYARLVLRVAVAALSLAKQWSIPVHAYPDAGIEGAENTLRHLGFKPINKEIWSWHGLPPQYHM